MNPLTRLATFTLRGAAAGLALSAVLFAAPDAGAQPVRAGSSASPVMAPASRCDLKSAAQVERSFERGQLMPISSYDDDPFAQEAIVECVSASGFSAATDGRAILGNARVTVNNESFIYRRNATDDFVKFAWNPWPAQAYANADGSFRFPDEARFPLFEIERDADGKPILVDGLQVWKPLGTYRGMTTAFEAANKVKDAADEWSGRNVPWGVDGILDIEPQIFIDFNAFYSPTARMLFFGIVPYRLANTTTVKMFETATSWEMAAHESGHAVQDALKPNRLFSVDVGWDESFADQFAMWTALRDPGRVRALLNGPSIAESNALSRIGEAFGFLVGGSPMRDAVNNAKVSTTTPEVHDRSQVLTGALYRIFVSIYNELRGQDEERALEQAGAIMGMFLTRTTDYTPENGETLEDVGKAHLKVDAELFGGRYRDRLVAEFRWREIFDAGSLAEWQAHEAALPDLRLPFGLGGREAAEVVVRENLDRLGVDPAFGLVVQSVTRDERFRQTIVRVQLTAGRDAGAAPLGNHGVLVFRENGTLADYHAPLIPTGTAAVDALPLLAQARHLGLDRHGALLSIVRKADGALGVEARVLRGDGPNDWLETYTLDAPNGRRRQIRSKIWGGDHHAEQLERAGIVLSADQLGRLP